MDEAIKKIENTEQPYEVRLEMAVRDYLDKKSKKTNPDGQFDNAGRWFPSEAEENWCCSGIRPPSRGFPYSMLTHCRSAFHIAEKYEVERNHLIQRARKIGGLA
jgi:hypothetical protein